VGRLLAAERHELCPGDASSASSSPRSRRHDSERVLDRRKAAVDGHAALLGDEGGRALALAAHRRSLRRPGRSLQRGHTGTDRDRRLAGRGRTRRAAGRSGGRSRQSAVRPSARTHGAGGRDRVGRGLPLLRARVVRHRCGVERGRRHGSDHPLMRDEPRAVGVTLMTALAASQAALVVLNPLLPDVARELDVSVPSARQLRAVSGFAAGVAALAVGLLATRVGLRELMLGAIATLACGSVVSALAPDLAVLIAAQTLAGLGIGVSYSAAVAATAEWST